MRGPYNNSCGKLRGYGLVNEPFNRLQAAVSTLTAGPAERCRGQMDAALIAGAMSDGTLLQQIVLLHARLCDAAAAFGDGSAQSERASLGDRVGDWRGRDCAVLPLPLRRGDHHAVRGWAGRLGAGELEGQHVAFEVNGTKSLQAFDAEHPIKLGVVAKFDFNLWTIAPVLEGGWALLGEAQTKGWRLGEALHAHRRRLDEPHRADALDEARESVDRRRRLDRRGGGCGADLGGLRDLGRRHRVPGEGDGARGGGVRSGLARGARR